MDESALLAGSELTAPLGSRATLVQFSSTFCAPCRATRQILSRVADTAEGVSYVELDVADHARLGERLGILATPTVVILDSRGVERGRASGAPTLAQVRAALAAVLGPA